EQTITLVATGEKESFDISNYKKTCLLNGYDDIDYLLSMEQEIEAFEENLLNFPPEAEHFKNRSSN
ncbi:MAG TPA: hypothetical protein VN958_02490, partial [Chitinophagaceae bacterium]|nr:hypothetical protein [Chitinophagaceae bacterium]